MMKTQVRALGVVLAAACAALSCAKTDTADTPAPLIAIPYTNQHEVIDSIIAGFEATVLERYPDARFFKRHANGNATEYESVVNAAIAAKPTLLAPITTPISVLALERAPEGVAVTFAGVTDPVGAGIVASIEQPGTASGSSDLCPFAALLEVTRALFPEAKTLGLPYNPSDQPAVFGERQIAALAGPAGFALKTRQVTETTELRFAVTALAGEADVIVIGPDNLMMENPATVVEAAATRGKPTVACDAASVQAGAVAGVSVNYREVGAAAGRIAVRVLGGEAVGTIPVAVLSSGEKELNLDAACRLGIEVDSAVVRAAAKVTGSTPCTQPARARAPAR